LTGFVLQALFLPVRPHGNSLARKSAQASLSFAPDMILHDSPQFNSGAAAI